jgi:hypothetical protein
MKLSQFAPPGSVAPPTSKTAASDTQPEFCRAFIRGSCRYGSDCYHVHSEESPSRGNALLEAARLEQKWKETPATATMELSKFAHTAPSSPITPKTSTTDKQPLLCRDFLKGHCRWGSDCFYPHSAESPSRGNLQSNVAGGEAEKEKPETAVAKAPGKLYLV